MIKCGFTNIISQKFYAFSSIISQKFPFNFVTHDFFERAIPFFFVIFYSLESMNGFFVWVLDFF